MINTVTQRKRLEPRKTPYFQRVTPGKFIGFYRMPEGGTWTARILLDGKRYFQPLGGTIDDDIADHLREAQKWFDKMERDFDPASSKVTLQTVVDDYLDHLAVHNSADASRRTKLQLNKHFIPKFGTTLARDLTTAKLKSWRDGLVKKPADLDPDLDDFEIEEAIRKSKDSANRVLSMVKASLNLAYQNEKIESDDAWRKVTAFKAVSSSRKLFLTDKQVASLRKTAQGNLGNFVEAGILTGARAGELASVRVEDFHSKDKMIELSGKTGHRDCYLSDEGVKFFKTQVKGKQAKDLILTTEAGLQWDIDQYYRPLRQVFKDAGLPSDAVFYSLRHYFISKALLAGLPAQLVAENCGTSIRMLEQHYAKFMKADRAKLFNQVKV